MDAYRTALHDEIDSQGRRLEKLRAKLDELNAEMATLTVRRDALRHAMILYDRTKLSRRERSSQPRRVNPQAEFVLNAIRESGAQGLTAPDIYKKVDDAGLEIPQHTVRSILHVRKKSRVLEHLSDGRYRFPQPSVNGIDPSNSEASAAGAADASDEGREDDLLGRTPLLR